MRKLNLGCGKRKRKIDDGWINIDIDPNVNPNIVRDLNKGFPFDTDSVDEVYCSHVVEHVKDIFFFMYEIWRVCKNEAIVEIIAPNAEAFEWAIQPPHVRFINRGYFEYWGPGVQSVENVPFWTLGAAFKTIKTELFNPNLNTVEKIPREIRFILVVMK